MRNLRLMGKVFPKERELCLEPPPLLVIRKRLDFFFVILQKQHTLLVEKYS